uniref:DUF551 domain-containing protein n=1 Tax=viral metagenome TaxID=1070528 RepID=A0A6M3LT44_9ZZZZ
MTTIEWIPVTERLPGLRREVLTWHRDRGVGLHTYYPSNPDDRWAWWIGRDNYVVEDVVITHWAEKPAGPVE